MFQQVTEVFGLEHLIGTKPEGVIFQFAMCLLLYNLIQVVRGVIAVDIELPRETISGEKLFQDVERQMIAWSETVTPEETIGHFRGEWTGVRVRVRLSELLSGVWREFTVAGPTTSMTVQLDWDRDAGTFPGHSGGPVIAAETCTGAPSCQ